MFDDEEGVALVAQVFHDADEPSHVARVQADARLVKDEQRVDERCAETGRQVDALDLAAGERAGRPVQIQVSKANGDQVTQPRDDLLLQHFRAGIIRREGQRSHDRLQPRDRELRQLGQVESGQERVPYWRGPARSGHETVVQGRRLETPAVAIGTKRVGPVAAQQHADVHLVGLGFEPVEIAFDPVPAAARPEFLVVDASTTFALDDEFLVRFREVFKRHVHVDFLSGAGSEQIALALGGLPTLERFDYPPRNREPFVRQGTVEVDPDGPPEPPALRARAHRVVERKEAGRRGLDIEIAFRAMPAGRKTFLLAASRVDEADFSLAETQGRFDGFGHSRAAFRADRHAVLDDVYAQRQALEFRRRLVRAQDRAFHPDPQVSLRLEEGKKFGGHRPGGGRHREGDQQGSSGAAGENLLGDAARGIRLDRAVARWAKSLRHPGHQELQVIVDFRDRPNRRTRAFNLVGLLDGDRRRDAGDPVHLRLVHAVEKLPRVGAKRLDVAALALGVNRVESERTFAAAAGTGDDVEPAQRQV